MISRFVLFRVAGFVVFHGSSFRWPREPPCATRVLSTAFESTSGIDIILTQVRRCATYDLLCFLLRVKLRFCDRESGHKSFRIVCEADAVNAVG
jgi:hypothetical protein